MPFFSPLPSLQLFYTLQGPETGPPLLVHGWCCNSHDWNFHITPLAQTYRVIAFDLRGHGQSSAPLDIIYKLSDHATDIAALLKHLGYEKDVRVIAHSMGAMITSLLSVEQPELFKALVSVDPYHFKLEMMTAKAIAAYEAAGTVTAVNLKMWPSMYGSDLPEWMKFAYLRRVEETQPHVIRGCLEGSVTHHIGMNMEEHLELRKKSRIPWLAVYADEEESRKEIELSSNSLDEVVVIGGMGNWLHNAKADEFNAVVGDWLKKVETS